LFNKWKSFAQNKALRELTDENKKQKEDIEKIRNGWANAVYQIN
jgi:hypothetical protein